MRKYDIKEFSFSQLTSNHNGKTSASGTMGVLICVVGALCFLIGCFDKVFVNKDVDIITQSIVFTGIGVALLGHRNHIDKKDDTKINEDQCEVCKDGNCTCKVLHS